MPAPFGLTTTGFSTMTFEEIRAIINARLLETISPTLDLSDRAFEGQIVAIVCEHFAQLWELAEVAHGALDSDKATGPALDVVAALIGTVRPSASASAVIMTLTGVPTTVVPEGSIGRVPDEARFATREAATIEAVDAWAPSTTYAVGDRVTNAGRIYLADVGGESAGSGGPTTTASAIVDGAVTWRYLGEGTGAVDVEALATEPGALTANAGTITEIVTPVGGWSSVANVEDAAVGRELASDAELRVLRRADLGRPGTGTLPAVGTDLRGVPGVTSANVLVNNTNETDVNGLPPHSIEALIIGGEDQDIWDRLHKSVPAGIGTVGDELGYVEDAAGVLHAYRFTRPEPVEIYVVLEAVYHASVAPVDLEDRMIAAVVAGGDALGGGRDVVASRVAAWAFVDDSLLDVVAKIGLFVGPTTSVTIPIDLRQLAAFDTSRVSVALTPGVP